jgi:hypothetical protein
MIVFAIRRAAAIAAATVMLVQESRHRRVLPGPEPRRIAVLFPAP